VKQIWEEYSGFDNFSFDVISGFLRENTCDFMMMLWCLCKQCNEKI